MKLGWQVGIVVAAVVAGLYASRKPWQVFREQRSNVAEIQAEMREAESEHVRLLEEKLKLSSPLGKEEFMRKLGWYRPGERKIED